MRYAAASGVALTVFQNRRYDAEQATVARVVADGLVGEPFRYEMRWERWRPVPKDRWRENASPTEGGGILLDLHSHLVDAAVQLFGPVATVFATVDARTTPAEDDAFLVCRHAGGVVSHLGATSLSGAPGPRVRLLGTQAAYVMADFTGEVHVWHGQADADAAHSGWLYRGDSARAGRAGRAAGRPTSTARWPRRWRRTTRRPRCRWTRGMPCTPSP